MLPHETEVQAEIAGRFSKELTAMTALHDAVMKLLLAGQWTMGKEGYNQFAINAMMGFLAKSAKTFRAIQILNERGLHEDANACVRVLIETMAVVTFILEKDSMQRIVMYETYSCHQQKKMFDHWRETGVLKGQDAADACTKAQTVLDMWAAKLPPGVDVSKHWSGKTLAQAMAEMGFEDVYAGPYRLLSSPVHASDLLAHLTYDESMPDPVIELEPRVEGFQGSYMAREIFWKIAHFINDHMGLGFDAILAPHELKPEDLPQLA
jgi:hypothetical protein